MPIKTTGIAGYTLIYNSYGMRLISHGPFTSVQQAIEDNQDILSTSKIFEVLDRRCTVEYTDTGADIKEQIESLKSCWTPTAPASSKRRNINRTETIGTIKGVDNYERHYPVHQ